MSTSGSSSNIVQALQTAKQHGLHSVLLTGRNGKNSELADEVYAVSSTNTARIQEVHMMALHILAGLIEKTIAEP